MAISPRFSCKNNSVYSNKAFDWIDILVIVRISAISLILALPLALAGCNSKPVNAAADARHMDEEMNAARQDLSKIPPPSKNLYMSVSSMNEWQNPSLTVQELSLIHI